MAMLLVTSGLAAGQSSQQSCVVIQELTAQRPLLTKGDRCATQLSPASTYKIPHALIALETGVVTADSVERWDGRKYERQPKWNQHHTIVSALRPSVLWLFQRIAPRIGAARAAQWLQQFDYGNGDVSGPIENYWINGRLLISAPQQVSFLSKLFRGTLPVHQRHAAAVREGLRQRQGTIENAAGVHALAGDWSDTTLFAKTGATATETHAVSWLVGLLQTGGRDYVFAVAVWHDADDVLALAASHLAAFSFMDAGLLPRRR